MLRILDRVLYMSGGKIRLIFKYRHLIQFAILQKDFKELI